MTPRLRRPRSHSQGLVTNDSQQISARDVEEGGELSPCYLPDSLVGGSRIRFVVRVGLMSDRLVEERLSRIAEQVAQAQRNSEATERVREQADSLEVEGTSKGGDDGKYAKAIELKTL